VYKDVLQGAGIMDALLSCLTSASPLCDLTLTQDLLWILICLADDDVVYKDFMREEGVLEVLTALFSVYQAHSSLPEIRPIAAQMLRWGYEGGGDVGILLQFMLWIGKDPVDAELEVRSVKLFY
jgi:hypothetical protein